MKNSRSIILFDGICNLCNGFVQFVIERDPEQHFQFASLQSDAAQALLKDLPPTARAIESIVLVQDGKYYQQSTAALHIFRKLSGGWPLLYGFKILPTFFRNWIYDLVAKNRYRWFGQLDSCMLPTPELRARFL